jgi:hypothetical protein
MGTDGILGATGSRTFLQTRKVFSNFQGLWWPTSCITCKSDSRRWPTDKEKTLIGMIRVSAIVIAASIAAANLIGSVQAQENPNATAQIGTKELNATKSQSKAVVSGGNDMGTYIDAVQNNFGNPNVVVTLPTNDAIGK